MTVCKIQINIINKNLNSNDISQTIQPISIYNNLVTLTYNYLNTYIKDFTIISDWIEKEQKSFASTNSGEGVQKI